VPLEGVEPEVARAIDRARERVRHEGRSAEAWGKLGEVLLAHNFASQADACFARAERLDPNNPRWPYFQALYRLTRDTDSPLPYLRRSAELCGPRGEESSAVRLLLAEALLADARPDEADEQLRRVAADDPDSPRLHFDQGVLAAARQDFEGAVHHLSLAAGSPFARQKACAQLAAVSLRRGEREAADEYSRRAARGPADRPWQDPFVREYERLEVGQQSGYLKGEDMEAEGRMPEAVRAFEQMARDYPGERSFTALGISLAKMGDLDAAEPVLRRALALAPQKVQAHYFLGVILYYQGERFLKASSAEAARDKFREAAESERQALAIKPDHGFALVYRGLALKQLGQAREALDLLREAVRCRPEMVEPHLYLGEALAEEGQLDEALTHLRHASEVAAPEDPRPAEAIAKVTRRRGEAGRKSPSPR
jgi:tetratricopeptide (TPR) repeat protein